MLDFYVSEETAITSGCNQLDSAMIKGISVILSTYNAPAWLEKSLWGYAVQGYREFEIIVADDGSGKETQQVIERLQNETALDITHIWQPDNGFQKNKILNKAIKASKYNYLLFSDGDCIPRSDLLETHFKTASKGRFLSGGAVMMPMETSKQVSIEDILTQRCFQYAWLVRNGLPANEKSLKLLDWANVMNTLTPTKATFNGNNSSAWKTDILDVNGFDERMGYGGEDRELGERLVNNGLKGMQIRWSAVAIHLDHKRSYKKKEALLYNRVLRKVTKDSCATWTDYGLKQWSEKQLPNKWLVAAS